jgi:hypothetical protein
MLPRGLFLSPHTRQDRIFVHGDPRSLGACFLGACFMEPSGKARRAMVWRSVASHRPSGGRHPSIYLIYVMRIPCWPRA